MGERSRTSPGGQPRHASPPARTRPAPGRPPRHARRARRSRHLVWTALSGVLLFLGTGVGWAYQSLDSNIASQDIEPLLGTDRPSEVVATSAATTDPSDPLAGQALDLLLIGVDDREGENARFGSAGQSGVRSDTVILAHIAADRSRVDLVSIPRDSWVPIPACPLPDGSWSQPTEFKFNQAFALGGATGDVGYGVACSIRTLEALTDVRIDGFVAVDFTGFIDMIDAIGGVPICVPEPIDDRNADIQLDAGYQVLDGEQALGFARVRKSVGDGSDTARIGRQQQLLAATIAHVRDQNVLSDSGRLYRFVDAATSSLTTSSDLGSISALTGLAFSLRDVDADDVTFATVPWVNRGDGANVLWTSEADELWAAIAADRPLDAGPDDETPSGDTPSEDTATPDDSPSLADDTAATSGDETESESC